MNTNFYVIINQYGFVKATKTQGVVKPGEFQIEVTIDVPQKAFEQPQFIANLAISEDQLPDIIQELDIELLKLKEGEEEN